MSKLIDRSLADETVVITRLGHTVVELKAVQPRAKPVPSAGMDWLAPRRVTLEDLDELAARVVDPRLSIGAGTLVRQMRDEDER